MDFNLKTNVSPIVPGSILGPRSDCDRGVLLNDTDFLSLADRGVVPLPLADRGVVRVVVGQEADLPVSISRCYKTLRGNYNSRSK